MNKSDLTAAIANATGLPLNQAEKALTAILDGIMLTLSKDGSVSLVGFGNFGVRKRAARKVRNPKTGEEMMVAEKKVPYFKAGKKLKEQVDSQK